MPIKAIAVNHTAKKTVYRKHDGLLLYFIVIFIQAKANLRAIFHFVYLGDKAI